MTGQPSEIEFQVMWNRLISVVDEQAQVLLRTSFSPIVREAGDLSAGVFDAQGRMLAQAVTGTPGHVNTMAMAVGHFLAAFPPETMAEGDVYITNDPWLGTGHLNDFVVTTPCFHRGKLVGFFSSTSHLVDIGGIGFGPDGTDVHMEGLSIPFLKFAERGRVNDTLVAMIRANTRLPIDTVGDTYALASCNEIGCRRLQAMMSEFGLDDLDMLGGHILERSRAAALAEIARLPAGTYRNTMVVDGYDQPVTLAAALTIGPEGIHVDYTGTSPASPRGINVPLAYCHAYTAFGIATIVAPTIPNNAGSLSLVTVSAPENTIVNPIRPAPVALRHVIGQMLPDVVFGCLRQAVPERVPAEGCSALWLLNMRGPAEEGHFAMTVATNGGTGGRPTADGLSATAFPSGVKSTPVEIMEAVAPIVVWRKELRDGSGGAGKFRGGDGQSIAVESRIGRDFDLIAGYDRVDHPARGALGGADGARGRVALASGKTLRAKGRQTIPAGERLILETPGGAGWGKAD